MLKKALPTVNASSMADIAFLLLIFFLVTTRIASEKGIAITLLPKAEEQMPPATLNRQNVYRISLNHTNEILLDGQTTGSLSEIKSIIKTHLTNYGKDENFSKNPKDAIVVLAASRNTNYEFYIQTLDKIKSAYHEVRAEYLSKQLGTPYSAYDVIAITAQETPQDKQLYKLVSEKIPMNLIEELEK